MSFPKTGVSKILTDRQAVSDMGAQCQRSEIAADQIRRALGHLIEQCGPPKSEWQLAIEPARDFAYRDLRE